MHFIIGLAVLCFYSKTGFGPHPSYCQISTDLDKILHTPIAVRYMWADLDHDRRVAASRPNQNDYVFFCNTCNGS